MRVVFALLVLSLAIPLPISRAQQSTPAVSKPSATASAPLDTAEATRAWLNTVPAEMRARSDAYFEGGYWLKLWNYLLFAGISIFILASGLSSRLRDFAERLTRFRFLQPALFAVPYVLVVSIHSFPLDIYSQYFREHAYGLATQSFGPWLSEQLMSLAVTLVTTSILLVVLYAVFRRAPRTWWVWGTMVGIFFLVLSMMIAPIFISPLFNKYT